MISGVFDYVPDEQEYPYVEIGEDSFTSFNGHNFNGFSGETTIRCYDSNTSSLKLKQIQSRIYELLHDSSFLLDSFKKINFRCKLTTSTVDNDNITQNGIQVFEFIFAEK